MLDRIRKLLKQIKLKHLVITIIALVAVLSIIVLADLIIVVSTIRSRLNVLWLIIFAIINYFGAIITHETGHLVGGLLSGYEFVYFRIGTLVLYYKDDKLSFGTRQILDGSVGEVLMSPPKIVDGHYPYLRYQAGGCAANLAVVLLFSLILFMTRINQTILTEFVITAIIMHLILLIMNAIPILIGGYPNDSYRVLNMTSNEDTYYAQHTITRIQGFLAQGNQLMDVPTRWFDQFVSLDKTNNKVAEVLMIKYEYHLELYDFVNAHRIVAELQPLSDNYIPEIKNRIIKEFIFTSTVISDLDAIKPFIENKEFIKSLEYAKNDMSNYRIFFTYKLLVSENQEEAERYYRKAQQLAKRFPIEAEAHLEISLMDFIREHQEVLRNRKKKK